ncbi:MAG TPA: hypothetical protein VG737_13525 [Cyclobacteriaceae bacterium]|nr:hypothetical protein [Cyclobacteriaceae bacterium]
MENDLADGLFPYDELTCKHADIVKIHRVKIDSWREVLSLNLDFRLKSGQFIMANGASQDVVNHNLGFDGLIVDPVVNVGLINDRVGVHIVNGDLLGLENKRLGSFFVDCQRNDMFNPDLRIASGKHFKAKRIYSCNNPRLDLEIQVMEDFAWLKFFGELIYPRLQAIVSKAEIPLLIAAQISL